MGIETAVEDMDELLLALLYVLGELLLEVVWEVAWESIVALIVRSFRNALDESNPNQPVLAFFGYLLLGAASGFVSVLLFSHPLVHRSRFHGLSLIVSPLVTGFIMSRVGMMLRRRGKEAVRIESFAYGFAFALGVAAIRLILVR